MKEEAGKWHVILKFVKALYPFDGDAIPETLCFLDDKSWECMRNLKFENESDRQLLQ